jgi:hypothetical protein
MAEITTAPAATTLNKEELVRIVRQWVKLDNEMRELRLHQKMRRDEKNKLTQDLMRIMKAHEVDSFDMNGGQIMYRKRNVKQPINQKYLLNTLSAYFEGDAVKAEEVGKFVCDHRAVVVSESIVHKLPAVSSGLET